MNIVVIGLTYPFRGGISHYTTLLCKELMRHHEVKLLGLKRQYPEFLFPGKTQKDYSGKKIFADSENIIDSMNPFTWIKAAWRIGRLKPDMVLIQWWQPFFGPCFGTIALLCRLFSPGTRVVFLCHNVRPHEVSVVDRLLSWYGYLVGNAFIVHSEEDKENLLAAKPKAKVMKSPHPTYDVFTFDQKLDRDRVRAGMGLDGPVILYFGYIRRYKGLKYLLQALPAVLAEMKVTLLVVGEIYDDREELLGLIDELGIRERIVLVDEYVPNEEVGKFFVASDVVVLPYVTATQSGIIQVAYGFEKGVITTDVGGLPEVVEDGGTGLLVKSKDPLALANAVLKFYREGLAEIFPENIRRKNEEFSWARMRNVIESLID
jgi:glycosyltransferase involved in cell wall biosynthesis